MGDEGNDCWRTFRANALLLKFLVVAKCAYHTLTKLGRIHGCGHVIDLIVTNLQHKLDEFEIPSLRQLASSIQIALSSAVRHCQSAVVTLMLPCKAS
ncbi:hypothetical protein D3C85_1661520 [compost metagenome]